MFWKLQPAFFKHLCPIYDRVHKYIVSFIEMLYVTPCKYPVLGKSGLAHYLFVLCTFLFIYIVRQHHIYLASFILKLSELFEYFHVCIDIYPVITVYYFKIKSCSIFKTCIYSFTMSSIFLMDCFYYGRVFFGIFICDFRCAVFCRSIVHYYYFYILSSRKD